MPFLLWTVRWRWHRAYGLQVKSAVQQLQWLAAAGVAKARVPRAPEATVGTWRLRCSHTRLLQYGVPGIPRHLYLSAAGVVSIVWRRPLATAMAYIPVLSSHCMWCSPSVLSLCMDVMPSCAASV